MDLVEESRILDDKAPEISHSSSVNESLENEALDPKPKGQTFSSILSPAVVREKPLFSGRSVRLFLYLPRVDVISENVTRRYKPIDYCIFRN